MAHRTFTAIATAAFTAATLLPSTAHALDRSTEAVLVSREFIVQYDDGSKRSFILRTGQKKSGHGAGAFGWNHIRDRANAADPETAEIHSDALSIIDTEWVNALGGVPQKSRGRSGRTSYVYSSEFLHGNEWVRKLCVIVGDGDLILNHDNYGPIGIISAFVKDPDQPC